MGSQTVVISQVDKEIYSIIRKNVDTFLKDNAEKYDKKNILILDIAPQGHDGAKKHFKKANVKTFDINHD